MARTAATQRKRPAARRQFLNFCDDGGDNDSNTARSACAVDLSDRATEAFMDGGLITPPRRLPPVRITGKIPLEDMPWSMSVDVVSERFKAFLEVEAPGHAQFFPVRVVGPKKLLPTCPYYLVNWTKVVDCIDFKRSEYTLERRATKTRLAEYDFDLRVLDPRKVPKNVLLFRLEYDRLWILIDKVLMRKIRKAGITGPQFDTFDY